MDIKLVAIDLDGTLLNANKHISAENIHTIRRVTDKGIRVVICSGRIFMGAKIYAKKLGVQEPIIACNGAVIRSMVTGETIYQELLDAAYCEKVIDILHDSRMYFHAYVGDSMISETMEYSMLRYSQMNERFEQEDRVDIKIVDDVWVYIQRAGRPVTKLVVMCDDIELLQSVRSKIEELEVIEVASSDKNNFEIMRKGVNKGKALQLLAKHMGYTMEQVMAIGDNENDIPMLASAGFPVAMQNGWEDAKRLAKFVTKSNDDHGVAHVLEKFLL